MCALAGDVTPSRFLGADGGYLRTSGKAIWLEEDGEAVAVIGEPAGLCSTCASNPTCTYARDSRWPVLHCEEYTSPAPARTVAAGKGNPSGAHRRGEEDLEEETSTAHKGLCRSCADRDVCTFPKPEGGVWRCEVYR